MLATHQGWQVQMTAIVALHVQQYCIDCYCSVCRINDWLCCTGLLHNHVCTKISRAACRVCSKSWTIVALCHWWMHLYGCHPLTGVCWFRNGSVWMFVYLHRSINFVCWADFCCECCCMKVNDWPYAQWACYWLVQLATCWWKVSTRLYAACALFHVTEQAPESDLVILLWTRSSPLA